MIKLDKILVPTDFSEPSERAAVYARELAKRYGSRVVCLHVSEIPADLLATNAYFMTGPSEQFIEQVRKEAKQSLDSFAEKHIEDAPVETVFLEGRPFLEIVNYARDSGVDLIVIATHGRTGLKHVLFGSVAEKVVRQAPCPVLVVKEGERDFVVP